jgi:hypothetical protein
MTSRPLNRAGETSAAQYLVFVMNKMCLATYNDHLPAYIGTTLALAPIPSPSKIRKASSVYFVFEKAAPITLMRVKIPDIISQWI